MPQNVSIGFKTINTFTIYYIRISPNNCTEIIEGKKYSLQTIKDDCSNFIVFSLSEVSFRSIFQILLAKGNSNR